MEQRRRAFEALRLGARTKEANLPQRHREHREEQDLLSKDQASDIFDRIRKFSTADETEVLISGGRFALTRFANNVIHQNVEDENHVLSVRTVFGGRTARAFTNKFDDESLRRAVASSESLAKVQHPDPDLLPMPDLREAEEDETCGPAPALSKRHFAETASITPQLRADGVKEIVDVAQKHKLTTAGIYSSSESVEGIFNSRGLSKWHAQTLAEVSITMLDGDSSGWQKANSPDVS